MVQCWVQIIDSDRVDAERLHEGGITQAERAIAQWVDARIGLEARRTSGLVAVDSVSCISRSIGQLWGSYAIPIIWNRLLVTLLTKLEPWTLTF